MTGNGRNVSPGAGKRSYTVEQVGVREYFRARRKELLLSLLTSLIFVFLMTIRSYAGIGGLFSDNPLFTTLTDRTAHIPAAAVNTATTLLDRNMNIMWSFIFLWIPVFTAVYFIFRFGIRPELKGSPFRLVRWEAVIATALFVLLLSGRAPDQAAADYISSIPGSYIKWVLLIAVFTISLTDFNKFGSALRAREWDRYQWFVKPAVIFAVSVLCFFVLEMQCGSKTNTIENMKPFNIAYWAVLQLAVYIIVKDVRPGAVISIAAAWFIGAANYLVMQFRGNYIMFGDLTVIRTALNVADNYRLALDRYFYIPAAAALIGIVLVIRIRPVRDPNELKGKMGAAVKTAAEILIAVTLVLSFRTGFLYGGIFGVAWDYNTNVAYNGYLPYFLSNANAIAGIDMEDYSADRAGKTIAAGSASYRASAKARDIRDPNIIVIQNEAFSDLSIMTSAKPDRDYMPFVRSLKKNTVKGYVDLSIKGGPTANSEFEFLTAGSMAFMPYGSVPFTQYMKKPLPSILSTIRTQPSHYTLIGYHPYYSSGYARRGVYSLLGFDRTVFYDNAEDSRGMKHIRGMVSDESDYEVIEKMCEESKDPVFIFNVTIQNHGGYTGNTYDFQDPVTLKDQPSTGAIDTYLSLMKESDKAFEGLVERLLRSKEKTVVLMYGDHQPSFDEASRDLLGSMPASADPEERTLSEYSVPYVIWANYDISEKDDMGAGGAEADLGKISLNYLGPKLFEIAGLALSPHDEYLLELSGNIPSVTAQRAGGNDPRLEAYREVQFEQLFGEVSDIGKYFKASATGKIK